MIPEIHTQPMLPTIIMWAIIAIPAILIILTLTTKIFTPKSQWVLRFATLLTITLLLLRPSIIGEVEVQKPSSKTDIFFVIDNTPSVSAEDWEEGTETTRLDGIRADVSDIIDRYPGARFSIMTYANNAQVITPLTNDISAVMNAVATIKPELSQYSNGSTPTSFGPLLEQTLTQHNKNNPDNDTHVYVFTDGENTSPNPPQTLPNLTEQTTSISIYGYGTETGGNMKSNKGYFITSDKTDPYIQYEGERAISKADPQLLQQIADETGGTYQHRTSETPVPVTTENKDLKMDDDEKQTQINLIDITWIPAILIAALLAIEITLQTMKLIRTRKEIR